MGDRSRKDRAASFAGSFISGALAVLAAILGHWTVFAVLLLAGVGSLAWGWWPEIISFLESRGLRLPLIRVGSWTSKGITWKPDGFTHANGKQGLLVKVRCEQSIQPMDFRVSLMSAESVDSYWVTLGMLKEIRTIGYWSPDEPNGAEIHLKGDYLHFRVSDPAFSPNHELVFNFVSSDELKGVEVQYRRS